MRRIYTALIAASMLMPTAAQAQSKREGYHNNTFAQIRGDQREAKARKEAQRRQFDRERQQRFAVADRYHQQQRVEKDRQRQNRLSYNHDRQERINRIRANQHSGRDASANRNRNIRNY